MRAKFVFESLGFDEEKKDVRGKVERSRKIPKELKEKIYPLIAVGVTRYKEGRVYDLKGSRGVNVKGNGIGADCKGFFVYTHRARCKSYASIEEIPQKDIDFIETTG